MCRNVCTGRGQLEMGRLRLNSAVPSSSFLPVCNYCVIAQSGFVGVDVYTHAIVQDLGGGEPKADLHCKCLGRDLGLSCSPHILLTL